MFEDTKIIGAGINGLLCAYYLLKVGQRTITVYDQATIPNPLSASFGKHRLIHPWHKNGCIQTAQKAISALSLWQDILSDIGLDGFEQTGVFVLSDKPLAYQFLPHLGVELLRAKTLAEQMPLFQDARCDLVYFFPQFGVLFADKILIRLCQYLETHGVRFYGGRSAVAVNTERGEARFCDGKTVAGDAMIIAAGWGTGAILQSSFGKEGRLIPSFLPKRCYVVYVSHPKLIGNNAVPAWGSLGIGDLWGMPPLRDIPMKLGCGDFTRFCDPSAAEDPQVIGQQIVARYQNLFPQFEGLEILASGFNHWAETKTDQDYIQIDKAVIATSDNGAGFKFAPHVAYNLIKSLTGNVNLKG